ncbi:MAG: aminotransferase class I/II-fold pyridoxal phosphate-dependent enzyme, partial [Bacteroidia bacterium]|nr:aminotransferase class I/II-fold pyridoxal phosphate-dependent enzyme [Bacteroidia bacterium]
MPTLPDLAAHLARLQTVTAHAGATPDPATGAVTQPLHLSTTFRHPANAAGHTGYLYSRADNPTRRELEAVLAELEQGEAGFAFSSGVAAIHAALAALRPGDHVLAHHQLYMGARALLRDFFLPWGLQVEFTDLRDLAAVATRFTAHTRLIWAETPSNPLLEGLDLAALAELAHTHGALLAVDNTFATPVGQQPLALGADLVMHATTKYLAGHSDVLGGGIVVRTATDYSARIRQVQQLVGGVPSPFDC